MARGVVVTWDGGRGFGFVRSPEYPEDVFVHVSTVDGRAALRAGQQVEFAAAMADRGLRATRVVPGRPGIPPDLMAVGLLGALLAAVAGALHRLGAGWVAAAVGGAWAVTWVVYLRDKRQAGIHGRRVPESVLLGLALLGGSPAAALAMLVLRHKTRKASFLARFAAVVALQVGLAVLIVRYRHG